MDDSVRETRVYYQVRTSLAHVCGKPCVHEALRLANTACARPPLVNLSVLSYATFEPREKGVPAAAVWQHVLVVDVCPWHVALTPVDPASDVVQRDARSHADADRHVADRMINECIQQSDQ